MFPFGTLQFPKSFVAEDFEPVGLVRQVFGQNRLCPIAPLLEFVPLFHSVLVSLSG